MEPTYTVAELSRVIGRAVTRAFPDEVWVEGEIRDLKRPPNGHVYFTLVDPDVPAEATLPVTLFAADRRAVNRALRRTGAVRMTDGVHVRIRGRVGHYAARGVVRLQMTWIDTDYTLGRLAAARRALLRRLEAEGLLERNALCPVPSPPLDVALVTSVGSAAHADFLAELSRSGYRFTVRVVGARVQGAHAAAAVAAALRSAAALAPDVIALVRGGGAQTDLAAFDAEPVALAIAGASVPVFTGVGHEIDATVADAVAARALKTPTACAQEIVSLVRVFVERLGAVEVTLAGASAAALARADTAADRRTRRLAAAVRRHVQSRRTDVARSVARVRTAAVRSRLVATHRLEDVVGRLGAEVGHRMAGERRAVAAATQRLRTGGRRAVAAQGRRLEALESLQRAHRPDRMLARGWSVTHDASGRLVRSPGDVAAGDRIVTTTAGGDIISEVEGTP